MRSKIYQTTRAVTKYNRRIAKQEAHKVRRDQKGSESVTRMTDIAMSKRTSNGLQNTTQTIKD